jgi:hypothetical protein
MSDGRLSMPVLVSLAESLAILHMGNSKNSQIEFFHEFETHFILYLLILGSHGVSLLMLIQHLSLNTMWIWPVFPTFQR